MFASMRPTLLVIVALVLTPATQQPSVTIDFTATADGQAVKDLAAADVTVKAGGKDRPLQSLEFIPTEDGGRDIFLYVDEPTLYSMEPIVKEAVTKLLASLRPRDRVGYASSRRGHLSPITERHGSVISAVATMQSGPGELFTCLSDLARTIESFAKSLPQGRATTLAIISRGADEDPEFGDNGASGCTPRKDLLRQVRESVSASQINLHFFTVHPNIESWGLLSLASTIGGTTSRLSWSDKSGLERLIASQTGFYRATIAADSSLPQRPQRVDVKTSRKKVKIKAPSNVFLAPKVSTQALK